MTPCVPLMDTVSKLRGALINGGHERDDRRAPLIISRGVAWSDGTEHRDRLRFGHHGGVARCTLSFSVGPRLEDDGDVLHGDSSGNKGS